MDKIIIIDFGSQYTQLIARKVRELNIFCEIFPYTSLPEFESNIKGFILSGSPYSVKEEGSPIINVRQTVKGLPVLGICYGAQMIAEENNGEVLRSTIREYGRANIIVKDKNNPLLKDVSDLSQVWMSHGDTISKLPSGFQIIAATEDIPIAAYCNSEQTIFGLQFHPEVVHTFEGTKILNNFLSDICLCKKEWTAAHFISTSIAEIKKTLGNDKVVMGLSGGVDSTVAATLLHRAIGKNLYCIFVDNGLLRKNEFQEVVETYKQLDLNVIAVDAKQEFYTALHQISDPEQKRKAIGKTFIEVFDKEAHKITDVNWLGQGTIYPDVIESAGTKGPSQTIKSHHNVGGLPDKMKLKIIEPLRMLFKDEVRLVAKELDIPESMYQRHPFPGPGLAIRILGEITSEKIELIQEADYIYIQEMRNFGLYDKIWQAAAILLPVKTVGVMGDERTYEFTVALRAVHSTDGMTADWYPLPYDFMAKVSNKIINSVKGINRVVYDISSKPPATIEWE